MLQWIQFSKRCELCRLANCFFRVFQSSGDSRNSRISLLSLTKHQSQVRVGRTVGRRWNQYTELRIDVRTKGSVFGPISMQSQGNEYSTAVTDGETACPTKCQADPTLMDAQYNSIGLET
jgi:hypothetical protein